MRLYTGAGLSILDFFSDLAMIYRYMTTSGQEYYAKSLAILVGLSLFVQTVLAWSNTRRGPTRTMLKELLIVLTGIAPGIHAMRVANGTEKSEHSSMDREDELTFARCIEMVLESIPGARRALALSCAKRIGVHSSKRQEAQS